MPAFDGAAAWVNSGPLGPADLHGRVVLVNFWTLTCINWLRTAPYVKAWSEAYRDDGLVVIGVHTPEFRFEHDVNRVRRATRAFHLPYPVVVDNQYTVWRAFDNHYWPASYFVDRNGNVRDQHFGEGDYERSARVLQDLLGVDRDPAPIDGVGVEAEADWGSLRSPETYLGSDRGQNLVEGDDMALSLPLNHWALDGHWAIGPEKVVLRQDGGRIAYRFHARDVHLVLSVEESEPIPFRVLLDGDTPRSSHGTDVAEDGQGVLRDGRLYQLVRQRGPVRERTVEITFSRAGAEAYAFTFG
jgi:thiol-disulfide isomerase/thioredoxin